MHRLVLHRAVRADEARPASEADREITVKSMRPSCGSKSTSRTSQGICNPNATVNKEAESTAATSSAWPVDRWTRAADRAEPYGPPGPATGLTNCARKRANRQGQCQAPIHGNRNRAHFIAEQDGQIQLLPLPAYSPELNPDEQVWNHLEARLAQRSIFTKTDMKRHISAILRSIQGQISLAKSFFRLPDTKYILKTLA